MSDSLEDDQHRARPAPAAREASMLLLLVWGGSAYGCSVIANALLSRAG